MQSTHNIIQATKNSVPFVTKRVMFTPNVHKTGILFFEPLHNNLIQYINPFLITFIINVYILCLFHLTHMEEPIVILNIRSVVIYKLAKGSLQTLSLTYTYLFRRAHLQTYLDLLFTTSFSCWNFLTINPCRTNIQATK